MPPFAVIRISVMHYTIPNKNVFYTSSFQKYYLKMSVAIRIDQHEINAENTTVDEKFPTPLINPLEKHLMLAKSILIDDWQCACVG